jgi:hypothetical protein
MSHKYLICDQVMLTDCGSESLFQWWIPTERAASIPVVTNFHASGPP